jgi:hypothetical protein
MDDLDGRYRHRARPGLQGAASSAPSSPARQGQETAAHPDQEAGE